MADRPLVPLDAIGGGSEVAAKKSQPDEKDQAEVSELQSTRDHELNLLRVRMGPIGRLIGSEDNSLTISFAIAVMCFVVLIVSEICAIWNDKILSVADNAIKLLLAIAGYIFGKWQGNSRARR